MSGSGAGASRTRQWRRILRALVAIAILMRIALIFRPDDLFYTRPFIEDAYYSFSVARSLGHGEGFTMDGAHPTNGVQPLIVLLYAPLFHYFPDATALRLCLVLDLFIEASLAFLLWRFIRMQARPGDETDIDKQAALIGAVLFYWSYSTSVYTLNGLETGLAPLLLLLAWILYRRLFPRGSEEGSAAKGFIVGVAAGLAVLARIDTAFFVLALCGHHIFSGGVAPRRGRMAQAIAIGATALAASSPWWLYNFMRFGNLVPTSGRSQSLVIPLAENMTSLIQLAINTLFVAGYIPYSTGLTKLHFLILAALLLVFCIALSSRRARAQLAAFFAGLKQRWMPADAGLWGMYIALLLIYYCFAFGAPHFLQRYLFILHLLALAAAAILLAELWRAADARIRAASDAIAIPLAVLMVALALVPYRWNFRESKAAENDFYRVARWIQTHVPETQSVGMGQSGTAGFFNRNVVNLDGKVNQQVLLAQRSGKYCDYMKSRQFDYLIDWEKFFTDLRRCDISGEYARIDSVGRFIVYQHVK